MLLRIVFTCLTLLAGTAFLSAVSSSEPVPVRKSFAEFPRLLAGWQGHNGQPFDPKVLEVLGVDEHVNLLYTQARVPPIGLYIGYYQSQRQGDAIHSPLNCLPGAGWEVVSKGALSMSLPGLAAGTEAEVNRYLIRKGGDTQLVIYWYQSHGRVIASEYVSKGYMILDAIRTNRTDAALVRVITPVEDSSQEALNAAEQRAADFVRNMAVVLPEYLPS